MNTAGIQQALFAFEERQGQHKDKGGVQPRLPIEEGVPAVVEYKDYTDLRRKRSCETFVDPALVGRMLYYPALDLLLSYRYSFYGPAFIEGEPDQLNHADVVAAKPKGSHLLLGSPWAWRASDLFVRDEIPRGMVTK